MNHARDATHSAKCTLQPQLHWPTAVKWTGLNPCNSRSYDKSEFLQAKILNCSKEIERLWLVLAAQFNRLSQASQYRTQKRFHRNMCCLPMSSLFHVSKIRFEVRLQNSGHLSVWCRSRGYSSPYKNKLAGVMEQKAPEGQTKRVTMKRELA
jgi:hypothetical protein